MTTSRRPFADPLVAACKPHSIAQGCELAQVTVAGLVSSRTHHCCCGRGRGGELLRDAQETRPCGLHAMRYMAIEWIVCREQKERASTRRGRATLRPSSGRRVVVRGSLIPYGRGQLERQSRRAIVMVMVTVQCSRPLPAGCDGSVYCTALCPSLLPVTGILPLYRAPSWTSKMPWHWHWQQHADTSCRTQSPAMPTRPPRPPPPPPRPRLCAERARASTERHA